MTAGLLGAAQRLDARVIQAQVELVAAGNRVTGVRLRDATILTPGLPGYVVMF
jgi:hypothetical protein